MTKRALLVALTLLPLPLAIALQAQTPPAAPAGDPVKGKVLWQRTEHIECHDCHGNNGEGGFGPDLAGRALTRAQFIHAVRKPWGVMPAYPESQISDQELMDIAAFFATLPSVAEPAPWRRKLEGGESRGLAVATTAGCAQCHHPLFNNGRAVMGAINATFEWFQGVVYAHTSVYPGTQASLNEHPERLGMGNFNIARLPEPMLRDVWTYISDLGFRARMRGKLSPGVPSTNGVVYTLSLENTGLKQGLTAEDLTVSLALPAGATVVATTGAGYQGVRRDEQAMAETAVWTVARMAPGERQTYTLTLSKAGTAKDNVRGTIRWMKPVVKTGPNDSEVIPPAPMGAETH
ncbi:MAG: c-type cytochrome [Vicinamibacterales bacterium]